MRKKTLNLEIYTNIAKSTEVFPPIEIEILEEVLTDIKNNNSTSYCFFEEKVDDIVVGFIIFGRIGLTQFAWDIYWLVVDKKCQGKGIGKRLLKNAETYMLEKENRAVIRVETSLRKEYTHARNLYFKQGYIETGSIPNFYSPDDGLIIFSKQL